MKRATYILILLVTLAAATLAKASAEEVIADCAQDGDLDRTYSNAELEQALIILPADLDAYSNCREVIAAAITPEPGPTAQQPQPAAGKRFVAEVVSGIIYFKCRGGHRQRLDGTQQLRVGCLIDARQGKIRITSAANADSSKTKSAVFSHGRFRVHEKRSKHVLTTMVLTGRREGCAQQSARRFADEARRRRRRGRRLWGRGKGRFRTKGRRSAATVTGTTWLVYDRCDGSTLTKVKKGKVRVRDFARHKTVRLKAGQSYVAGRGP